MRRPGVQLQLALAAVTLIAVVALGRSSQAAGVAAAIAVTAAVLWGVRAVATPQIPAWADLTLLALILTLAAVAAIPTHSVAIAPMVGSLIIVSGDALRPSWTRWVWPVAAAAACAIGYALAAPSLLQAALTAVILIIGIVAATSRRAAGQANLARLQNLQHAHAVELEQLRIATERILTTDRLRERFPALTPRETEVLALIAHGDTNDDIASRLYISTPTVKTHVNNLFAKLPARDRAHAIALVLGTARTTQDPDTDTTARRASTTRRGLQDPDKSRP